MILGVLDAYWVLWCQAGLCVKLFWMITWDIWVIYRSLNRRLEANFMVNNIPLRYDGRSHSVWSYWKCCVSTRYFCFNICELDTDFCCYIVYYYTTIYITSCSWVLDACWCCYSYFSIISVISPRRRIEVPILCWYSCSRYLYWSTMVDDVVLHADWCW